MTLNVINPYDQSIIADLDYDTDSQLSRKISNADAAFQQWRQVSLIDRIDSVRQALQYFSDNKDEIARDISLQMGKPIQQAHNEVNTFFSRASYLLEIAPQALQPDIIAENDAEVRRLEHVPLGIILNMAAWNYPLLIPVNVIVPALLAGNVVLLKHSNRTPLTGQAFETAFATMPVANTVTSLLLTHEQVPKVIADPRVQYVAFTGSIDGGHVVYEQVAQRFIDVGLELGGKDPAYIAEDADVEMSAESIVDGACYNAGQSCCGIERVYIHQSVYDAAVKLIVKHAQAYVMGDPLQLQTTLGPLVTTSAPGFLQSQVDDACELGAKIMCGGIKPEKQDNFYPATVLTDVPAQASVMQDESFGPIIPIVRVNDDAEALRLMQDSNYGLTASIWTRSRDRAEQFAKILNTGTVFMNRCDFCDPALAWTGVGDSGKGVSLSRYGFYSLTRLKSINFRN